MDKIRFIKCNRGVVLIYDNEHIYVCEKRLNDCNYYRCRNKQCPSKITIEAGIIRRCLLDHNHQSQLGAIMKIEANNELKQKVNLVLI